MTKTATRAKLAITPEQALILFHHAPNDALLTQEIIAAVYQVPTATLEKARCIGEEDFPPFVKLGARVRYRAGSVRAHLAGLTEKRVA
jgi:hypothetical protein